LSTARAEAAAEALEESAGSSDVADATTEKDRTTRAHPEPPGQDWTERHTAALLRTHADRAAVAGRQRQLIQGFTAAHPRLPSVQVPVAAADIADLPGLRLVATGLTGRDDTLGGP
jgi:hypothetical protein